jgi:D-glycero-D-manno-heptose 1,7-bisphosphate phosphatase
MFKRIAACFNADMKNAVAVGDSLRDLQAADTAGALPILVRTGKGDATFANKLIPERTLVFADLAAAVNHILRS